MFDAMWGLVTSILYIECGIVSLLVLPIVKLNQWQQLFHSNFIVNLSRTIKPWLYVYVCLLACCLLNSLRIMNQNIDAETYKDEEKLMQYNLKQVMAQRNFYISAASIFLMALSRRLVLMKMNQAEELDDFFNIGVEYKPGRRELTELPAEEMKFETQSIKTAIMEPPREESKYFEPNDDLKNWADLEEWSSRMRRITASLVREEKNNEVLKTCANRLSNFCMRLDQDYQHLQNIIGESRRHPVE